MTQQLNVMNNFKNTPFFSCKRVVGLLIFYSLHCKTLAADNLLSVAFLKVFSVLNNSLI